MRKVYFLIVFIINITNATFAQSAVNGVFEYEVIHNIYNLKAATQARIEEMRKGVEMSSDSNTIARQVENVRYLIKEDSLLSFFSLFEQDALHLMEVQMNFWAWSVMVDSDSKKASFLSDDAVAQLADKNLQKQKNWRDQIKVNNFYKYDYKKAIRHKKEKLTILGYKCTMYELTLNPGGAVNFYWIAESLRPAKNQQLPYAFNSIFTPYGVILKEVLFDASGETTRIIKKLELKTIESFAKELSALNLKLE